MSSKEDKLIKELDALASSETARPDIRRLADMYVFFQKNWGNIEDPNKKLEFLGRCIDLQLDVMVKMMNQIQMMGGRPTTSNSLWTPSGISLHDPLRQ